MKNFLFHLLPREEWVLAKQQGEYRPQSLEEEGFIHLATGEQIATVRNRLYSDRSDLVLLVIDEMRLDAPLRWETPEIVFVGVEGWRFPHLYGPLNLNAVVQVLDPVPPDLEEVVKQEMVKRLALRPKVEDVSGKVSTGLGVLTLVLSGIVLTRALLLGLERPEANPLQPVPYAILTMVAVLLSLLGGAFGIAGLFQDRQRGWSAAGCFLSAVFFCILSFLALLAMSAGAGG
uniref:Glutathione S-transferase domain-containing protein n=1 Tax=uncultured Chloroflexota bacterium TaxID=166587 RepID=H5SQ39_9CHLR|nr:glutathione S-transferase domain-containing protein [uncultured Chloroflexota bacterium]